MGRQPTCDDCGNPTDRVLRGPDEAFAQCEACARSLVWCADHDLRDQSPDDDCDGCGEWTADGTACLACAESFGE